MENVYLSLTNSLPLILPRWFDFGKSSEAGKLYGQLWTSIDALL